MAIKVLDLFAGAGGLALGLESVRDANGRRVFELYRAVEIYPYACDTLRKNFGSSKVIEGDLTDKGIHERIIRECKGKVSVIAGGIPCQSFSLLGPRSGYGKKMEKFRNDKRDHLYREFRKIVREILPKVVIIENVSGILSKKDRKNNKVIDKLIADFERLGYEFRNSKDRRKYMVLNAADYGVPQIRERVILIGIQKKWKKAEIPYIRPTHGNGAKKGCKNNKVLPYITLFEAIGDLPKVSAKITFTGMTQEMIKRTKKRNEKIYNGEDEVPFDKVMFKEHLSRVTTSAKQFFEYVRPNGYKVIHHHVARSQQKSDLELFGLMREGETAKEFTHRRPRQAGKLIKYNMDSFEDKYRKQKRNALCTTVFAHLEKDGNRFIHPTQCRTITPREAARIQSFPDNFVFCGPYTKKFRQIGNAVPPLMACAIGKELYSNLWERK